MMMMMMMMIREEKEKNTCSLLPLKFISNNLWIIYAISIYDILQVKTFLQKH